jgi:hypothetical protein
VSAASLRGGRVCCNDDDCGAIRDDEWRETTTGTEILIRGRWCQVEKEQFIYRGKSPDWNVAHACIFGKPPNKCDRLYVSQEGESG